jgi:hypothetical protein
MGEWESGMKVWRYGGMEVWGYGGIVERPPYLLPILPHSHTPTLPLPHSQLTDRRTGWSPDSAGFLDTALSIIR